MPRSIWSGVISFGVVSIPVKLYTATESKDVSFHLLHKECSSRLKQLRWCPPCERALAEKGLTAGAQIAIRNKERLCVLRPLDGALMLQTLFYPDEIRVQGGAKPPAVQVSEQELTMAFTLIELLSGPFDPAGYRDEYWEALMEVIEAKLQGQALLASTTAAPGA